MNGPIRTPSWRPKNTVLNEYRYVQDLKSILDREQGAVFKSWGGRIPVALVYPNRYAAGMSNLGFQLTYSMLNRMEDVVCERAFFPDSEDRSREAVPFPPRSLESQRTLNDFEILAFSIPFENDYPNILKLLKASGIPLEAQQRTPPHPLVWAGGITASLNPEPLAPFVDLFGIGDAELLIPDLIEAYRRCKDGRLSKESCLENFSRIEGVYAPSLYDVEYDDSGRISRFRSDIGPDRVRRRIYKDTSPMVPATKIVTESTEFESMFLVEISRGCPWGCRFCAVGRVALPVRHHPVDALMPVIEEGLKYRKRIGLVSSSVCDHPQLLEICERILSLGGFVSVASLRLDRVSDELLDVLMKSGHKTLSLAPEAGSQRLRDVIKKNITEEQILSSVERIALKGVAALRFYFMVGLPTEEREDVEAIVTLAKKCLHHAKKAGGGKGVGKLTLSINPFIPKPFTPFQWSPFAEVRELKAGINLIRRAFQKERSVHVIHELPKWARIQALLSRGDRKLSNVLEKVGLGRTWAEALKDTNLNPDFYLHRERGRDECLPWDFIDHGFSKDALWRGYERGLSQTGGRSGVSRPRD